MPTSKKFDHSAESSAEALAKKDSKINELLTVITEKEHQIAQLQRDTTIAETLLEGNDELESLFQSTQHDLRSSHQENEQLKTKLEETRARLNTQDEQLAQAQDQVAQTRLEIQKLQTELRLLKRQNQADLEHYETSSAQNLSTIEALQEEINTLTNQQTLPNDVAEVELLNQIATLEKQIVQIEEKSRTDSRELQDSKDELQNAEEQLHTLQDKFDNLSNTSQELAQQLQEKQQAFEQLRTRADGLESRNDTLARQVANYETIVDQKNADLRVVQDETTALKNTLQSTERRLSDSENTSSRLQMEVETLTRLRTEETTELNQQLNVVKQQLSEEKQQSDKLHKKIGTVSLEIETPIAPLTADTDNRPLTPPPTAEMITSQNIPAWKTFLQHGGAMANYFQDELIRKGDKPTFAERDDVDILSIAVVGGTEPLYEAVKLKQGDYIQSTAQFPKEGVPGESVVGVLVQDHNGRIINKTTDTLSESQKCLMAMRQAEMTLNGFKPKGNGDDAIVIDGNASNAEQAQKLVAALFLLKGTPPHDAALKDVKIISNVPGCKVPETVNNKFIEKFLPSSLVSEVMKTAVQTQVTSFAEVKQNLFEKTHDMKHQLQEARAHAEESTTSLENTLEEGDMVNLKGVKQNPG